MGKGGTPSIGERIINALAWWRSSKEKHRDLAEQSNQDTPVTLAGGNTENLLSSSLEMIPSGTSLGASVEAVSADVGTPGSIPGKRVQVPAVHRDPMQLIPENNLAIDGTSSDQSGFFAFLDDVIAGKHNELLKEMNKPRTSNRSSNDDHLVEGRGTSGNPSGRENPQRDQQPLTEVNEKSEECPHVPTHPPRGPHSSAARSLKNYERVAYLGEGTFAEVTLARQKDARKLFALKKISKEKVGGEGCVERTLTERLLLASLGHPFLVRLHEAFQSRTHLYLLLDFAQGGDFYYFLETKPWVREMKHRLHTLRRKDLCTTITRSMMSSLTNERKETGGLTHSASPTQINKGIFTPLVSDDSRTPIRLIAFYAVEIALVLQYLHEKGYIYRDLKPENILMMRSGHIVLTDFGVATYRGSGTNTSRLESDRKNSFTGTTPYMSPEMLLGEPHDSRIDWWSFGCLLFEMATGRRPFAGKTRYAVVQSIVERVVCVHPDDFLFTELEVNTRVMQIQKRHRAYQRAVLQDMTFRACGCTKGNENGLQFCESTSDTALSTAGSPTRFLNSPSITSGSCSLRNESRYSKNDSFTSTVPDTSFGNYSVSTEEYSQYLRYAVHEMEEASMLLRELALLLLERKPERRLSGVSVLEHPFFSCSYVTSQLYYEVPCFLTRSKAVDVNANTNEKSGVTWGSCQKRETSEGSSFAKKQKKLISSLTNSFECADDNENDDDLNENGNDSFELSQTLQKHLSAEFFLSLPPHERPGNWRERFLKKRIKPLFTPRLFAADDLRYFPAASTATGDSILAQQRTLRRQRRRKHEGSFHSCGNDNVTASPVNRTTNTKNSTDEDTDVVPQASLSSFTGSDEEFEEPTQPSVPVKTSCLPPRLEKDNAAMVVTEHQGDASEVSCGKLEIPPQDSTNTVIPTLVSSERVLSSSPVSVAHHRSGTVRDGMEYRNDGEEADSGVPGCLKLAPLSSHTTTDEEEGTQQVAPDSAEMLQHTLSGIAYDVDDYLPGYSEKITGVLQCNAGISTSILGRLTGGEDPLLGKVQVFEASGVRNIVAADHCEAKENEFVPSSNPQGEKSPQERIGASLIFPSAIDSLGRGNSKRGSVCTNSFATLDTRQISNIPLLSTDVTPGEFPLSPKESTEFVDTPEIRFLRNPIEDPPLTRALDERTSSRMVDNPFLFGTGGGQHFLGFTFDAHSGGALLLEGMGSSSSDIAAFSDMS